jgi:hypothetical protein
MQTKPSDSTIVHNRNGDGLIGCCVAFSNMAAMARWTWSGLSIGLLYRTPLGLGVRLGYEMRMPGSVGMACAGVKLWGWVTV